MRALPRQRHTTFRTRHPTWRVRGSAQASDPPNEISPTVADRGNARAEAGRTRAGESAVERDGRAGARAAPSIPSDLPRLQPGRGARADDRTDLSVARGQAAGSRASYA